MGSDGESGGEGIHWNHSTSVLEISVCQTLLEI
jgi:hypothetical protein